MSVYLVKLLELVSIENENNKSYLRVKLSNDKKVEMLWEIDSYTANILSTLTTFNAQHKYRLSFHSKWDSTKNQYFSYMTKTYKEQSENIYFPCSEAYVNGLKAIKHNEKISEINILSSVTKVESLFSQQADTKKHRKQFSMLSIVLFSILVIFIATNIFQNKIEMNDKASVKAESISKEVHANIKESYTIASSTEDEVNLSVANSMDLQETEIPFVELHELVNFSIPKDSVALTFDDGPSKYTKEITDILKEYDVGGTFFFVGNNISKHTDSVQYVKDNGYSIGSHSMSHANFAKLSAEQQEYELLHSIELIENITHEKITLFRPPYGAKNDITIELMKNTNNKMVLWNSDTEDWKSRDAQAIYKYVVETKSPGSIILLHESQAVIDALPNIIEYLHEQNLKIVNLK